MIFSLSRPPKVLIITGDQKPYAVHMRDFFAKLPNLVEAKINNGNVKVLPAGLLNSSLKKLDLSNNGMTEIATAAWNNLGNLTVLNLSHNKLYAFPSYQFKNLTSLQVLDLSYNRLKNLTDKPFHGLNSLRELRLDNNKIKVLGANAFPEMKHLVSLDISDNKLKALDELAGVFSKAPMLEKLDLSRNSPGLGAVSGRPFENLTCLKYLYLNKAGVNKLEDDSFRSMKLEHLDLASNDITSISASAFSDLKCTILKLGNNDFNTTELRRALSGLQGVKELDLSSSQFKSLPAELFAALEPAEPVEPLAPLAPLANLERLDLSNNLLKELPKLPAFQMIKVLNFSENVITSISKGLTDFEFMPEFWHRLSTRQLYLDLQGNPLTCQSCDVDVLKLFESKNYKCQESDSYCLRCQHPSDMFGRKIVDLPARNSSSPTSDGECEAVVSAIRGHYSTKGSFIYFLIITILMVVFFVSLVLLFVFRKKVNILLPICHLNASNSLSPVFSQFSLIPRTSSNAFAFSSLISQVFRSVYRTGEYRANGTYGGFNRFLSRKEAGADPAQKNLLDGDEQVQSNCSVSNKSADKEQEICMSRLDPPKFANGTTDATKQQSAKNDVAPFEKLSPRSLRIASEKPNAVQQSDASFV